MHDALTARFDDIDEIRDVANYGCAAGVSGFIYYHETEKFFDEYEDEIYDYSDRIIDFNGGFYISEDCNENTKSFSYQVNDNYEKPKNFDGNVNDYLFGS